MPEIHPFMSPSWTTSTQPDWLQQEWVYIELMLGVEIHNQNYYYNLFCLVSETREPEPASEIGISFDLFKTSFRHTGVMAEMSQHYALLANDMVQNHSGHDPSMSKTGFK